MSLSSVLNRSFDRALDRPPLRGAGQDVVLFAIAISSVIGVGVAFDRKPRRM